MYLIDGKSLPGGVTTVGTNFALVALSDVSRGDNSQPFVFVNYYISLREKTLKVGNFVMWKISVFSEK